ncbi:hypothetical protein J132_05566 [Termitomyces sp. J132]|nr:hypothetical protein C0989_007111 [Termitomyces sp. Mn162]KNZ80446.1 hypothetical protein J132_05566 [Termitomyces sp. J132]
MRRPRGPGGRFLTADEIAAQKLADPSSPSHPPEEHEDDIDDDDAIDSTVDNRMDIPSPVVHDPDPFINPDAMDAYRLPISQPHSQSHTPPDKSPSHNIYTQHPAPSVVTPISLSSYPSAQMHHVPHPHAHARHHHSRAAYLYSPPDSNTSTAELQRRTEEIINFGAAGSS